MRDDQIQQIQDATDIVQLIGEQIALKPKGREFACVCPFHDDKNPSMFVAPAKQIYKCFACGAGGNVFSFVMNYHRMSFPESLKYLAERAGITIETPKHRQHSESDQTDRRTLSDANALAVSFFQTILKHPEHGIAARRYLDGRGVTDEMIETFQIGYAPDRWDGLVSTINSKNWNIQGFDQAGLLSGRSDGSGFVDRFRNRLIFPISDSIGRPIAFGARRLNEQDEPKYLNSPETALFNKSKTLYGLYQAMRSIIDSKTAVVVEGYTDVIACHQAGIKNVVAALGTAFTAEHVGQLNKRAEKVVLIFDADAAGQKAADRAVEIFLTQNMDVFVAVLPDGLDPAELIDRENGVEQWHDAVGRAKDALEYQFDRVRNELDAQDTITGRQRVAEDYLRRLAGFGLIRTSMLRRSMVIQRLAGILHLSEQQIDAQLKKLAPSKPASPPQPIEYSEYDGEFVEDDVALDSYAPNISPALKLAEKQMIGGLLHDADLLQATLPDGRPISATLTENEFVTPQARELFVRIRRRISESQDVSLQTILGELAADERQDLANFATETEIEVEQQTDKKADRLREMVIAAVTAMLKVEHDRGYQQLKATATNDEALQKLFEHQRSNPDATRIPVV